MNLKELVDEDLLNMYGEFISELKDRKIIRTKNIVGDLGEYFAKEYYNKTPGLPNLLLTDKSTRNIDAVSNKGERYSIKTTTTATTGTFWEINKDMEKVFEYLIIVKLNDCYELEQILELDWNTFIKYIKINKRMNAYMITITKALVKDSKIIYTKSNIKQNKLF